MKIVPTNMTVIDYCGAMERGEIVVNREYQRSDKVWPATAKSFLIETLILGFPMPKLSLYQITDLKSRKTVKEIVDGQQRSQAIQQFLDDEFRLSGTLETEEIAGKRFSQLPEELQGSFVSYSISIDLFVAASPDEVREIFRRMNSYTVPLNPEEQRHASFQGQFKWFAYRLAHEYGSAFVKVGLFTDKQIVRMADVKLITEISHALIHGISTTNKRSLNGLYRSRDREFPEQADLRRKFARSLDIILTWEELHGTALMKPYMVYSLLLAVMHAQERVPRLSTAVAEGGDGLEGRDSCIRNLALLLEATSMEDLDEGDRRFAPFVLASSSKTNTAANRRIRFEWYYRAITEEEL